jgi:hypothetical protein
MASGSGSWVRVKTAIAPRLLIGKKVYRHLLSFDPPRGAVQGGKTGASEPNHAIIEDSYPALSATFCSIVTGSSFPCHTRSESCISPTGFLTRILALDFSVDTPNREQLKAHIRPN